MMDESVGSQEAMIVGCDIEENVAYQKVKAADGDEDAVADRL